MSKKIEAFVGYWHQHYEFDGNVEDFIEHARALEAMLKELDKNRFDRVENCPVCGNYRRHSPDCELARLLE